MTVLEIHVMDIQIMNLQQFLDAFTSIWTQISVECSWHLLESVPKIVKVVPKAKGGSIWHHRGLSDKAAIECKPSHSKTMTDVKRKEQIKMKLKRKDKKTQVLNCTDEGLGQAGFSVSESEAKNCHNC